MDEIKVEFEIQAKTHFSARAFVVVDNDVEWQNSEKSCRWPNKQWTINRMLLFFTLLGMQHEKECRRNWLPVEFNIST